MFMFSKATALISHLFPTDYKRAGCVARARAPTKRTGVKPLFVRCVQMRLLCAISKCTVRIPR